MNPTELKALIKIRFNSKIKRALHIESSPGVGKTQITAQVAKELGVGFKVIHAPLLQPEDYGLPVPTQDRQDVNFLVSKDKFPIEGSDCPDTGIFLIDELPQADANAQKILANLIQEREIHGKKLKDGWMIISTGNRVGDRSGANRLLSHLKNRITTIPLEPNIDDWTNWALDNNVSVELVSFIRFRPELLNDFDAKNEISATPRAWVEGVAAQLGVIEPSMEHAVFSGDVGEGASAEFLAFLKIYRELPSIESIIMEPKKAKISEKPAVLYAICGALSQKTTADNFDRVMEYIDRLPTEFSVLYVRDAIKKSPDIQTSKAFIKWATKNGKILLT